MSNKDKQRTEMVARSKNKVWSCSTPEHRVDSPSRDSDSVYDSDAASPVPFLCTQDGAEGETDVVWNFYTPKSGATNSNIKNTTPVSRRVKKSERLKHVEKPPPKRRTLKATQKKNELFQELIELNHNLQKFIPKPVTPVEKQQSEEDIFSDGSDSPRSGLKSKNRCLRKNVLSSKFIKTDAESGLESDDSMNEYLLKVSQAVEEHINCASIEAKRPPVEPIGRKNMIQNQITSIDQDSMDAILSNIKIESPHIHQVKICDTPKLNNDSFDNLLGNLNDSALERLSQFPVKNEPSAKKYSTKIDTGWSIKDSLVMDVSPSSKTIFGRHSSMPESPTVSGNNKPSTSGMVFGRYSSMPFNKSDEKIVPGDSPIRCTPEEIKVKHQQARERLLAKRALPFTPTQQTNPTQPPQPKFVPKKPSIQPKTTSIAITSDNIKNIEVNKNSTGNIKLLIEKKRQEALMKLRRRHPQNKY